MTFQQAPDPTSAVPEPVQDSVTNTLSTLSNEVSAAGRLLYQGDWEGLWTLTVDGAIQLAADMTPKVLSALFVAAIFYGIYRLVLGLSGRLLRRSSRVGSGLEAMTIKTLRVLGLSLVALLALSQLGVNVSAVVAGLGIAGLAVGFAAKDSLENFISGLTILLDQPFRVGHWVKVGERYGRVTDLTLRSTRIRTLNREELVIPNSEMVNQPVVNQSATSSVRVDVPFGIAYKEDIDETRDVVMGLTEDDGRLSHQLDPRVVVTDLGDSSVNMELHLFLEDPQDVVPVRFDYTERIRKALAEADIEIPFPHLQLFIDGADALKDVPALQGTG